MGAAEEELVYELDDWDEQARAALTTALTTAGITHEWEGPTLVVQADDEDAVEQLMDEVDDELTLTLDQTVEHVAYDLSEWSEDQRVGLAEVLADAGIPNGWEGDELFVHEIDALLSRITDPQSALEADASGGMAGAEIMSELFVSADRLMHDAQDHEGTLSLIDASRMASIVAVPYGIDDEVWAGVVSAAATLASLVEGGHPDEDAVIDQATALRHRLRPLI